MGIMYYLAEWMSEWVWVHRNARTSVADDKRQNAHEHEHEQTSVMVSDKRKK
jgi:hypothetical protein